MGFPQGARLPRGHSPSGESRRRCRHDGCCLRAVRRSLLGRVGDSAGMAGRTGRTRADRHIAARPVRGKELNAEEPTTYELAASDATPPTSSSYWVVPHLLLAGAYPGDLEAEEHHAKVKALLGANIRSFVNLMDFSRRTTPESRLCPTTTRSANTSREPFSCRHPINDLCFPAPTAMLAILDFIDRSLKLARSTYVHCSRRRWANRNRGRLLVASTPTRHTGGFRPRAGHLTPTGSGTTPTGLPGNSGTAVVCQALAVQRQW